jgi:hypothetical protein
MDRLAMGRLIAVQGQVDFSHLLRLIWRSDALVASRLWRLLWHWATAVVAGHIHLTVFKVVKF